MADNLENLSEPENLEDRAAVSSAASAAAGGVALDGQKILDIVNALPSKIDMSAAGVRLLRKAVGNPFDHADTDEVSKEDIVIPSSGHSMRARVYRPKSKSGKLLPALVYFHGGGFVVDDIESHDRMLAKMVELSGVMAVSVEYRLAPETPFPGAVEDAVHSFCWIQDNAGQFLIDANKMAVGGDSAGANLAAVVCLENRDSGAPTPILQLLIYPCTIGNDTSGSREQFSEGYLLTKESIQWYHGQYISEQSERDPRFHILSAADHSDLPQAFVLTCGFDPLRDEGLAYANKLEDSGVVAQHSCYTDMFHGFITFGTLAQSRAAVAECAKVLSDTLLSD